MSSCLTARTAVFEMVVRGIVSTGRCCVLTAVRSGAVDGIIGKRTVKTSRIFVSDKELSEGAVAFSASNSRYILQVLRLRSGDRVKIFDGREEYMVRLDKCGRRQVSGCVVESLPQEPSRKFDLTLAFCCVRPGPMTEIFRHGTEIGVTRFAPILSLRSNRRPAEKKNRWESVVASACAQSGRVCLPEVLLPLDLEEFIHAGCSGSARIILSNRAEARPLLEILDGCISSLSGVELLVGPEGGFDPAEKAQARSAGFLSGSLGPGVLRTETAAVAAAAIVAAWRQADVCRHAEEFRHPEDMDRCVETATLRANSGD